MSVRVRYAPSPTGSPHVGNIRTALYNHLFARRHQGTVVLRIEDTDRARAVPGCEEEIIESLAYVGVEWQEGPHRQSERAAQRLYRPHVDSLLESGHAYLAFETPEELAELREEQSRLKQNTGYFGGAWRDAEASDVARARTEGKPGVLRLRIPRDETIRFEDAVRGKIEVDSNVVDDPVLIKADGMPTYHFAAMVDDHLMGITHVFRGEEWIASAPKHIVLFQALGWEPPVLVHLPVIKGKDGSKLSKRHGDTACLDFRRAGYLGDALANFIALIGWSPGDDREIMSLDEMSEAFDLRGIQPSSGVFDPEKLDWMQGEYVRARPLTRLAGEVRAYAGIQENIEFLRAKGEEPVADSLQVLAGAEPSQVGAAVGLLQQRCTRLGDFGPACKPYLVDQPEIDPTASTKWFGEPHVRALLSTLRDRLLDLPGDPDETWCEETLRGIQSELSLEKFGPIVHPVRVALTGTTVGPGLFELMSLLGRDRMATRLEFALGSLPV